MSTAGTLDIVLSRTERQPWGFRLHGGSDFGTPLIIQKVRLCFHCQHCLLMSQGVRFDLFNCVRSSENTKGHLKIQEVESHLSEEVTYYSN